ncbi:MAG: MATE family efflux transporter [Bacteroidales bacterium]|jgi:putative MATE family efflux protein|nr:MATE family efflux transporter [Bacteroidales bacterium]
MSKERGSEELGQQPVGSLLFKYALPAVIAMTASSLYNIIDRIFIGQGVDALAISGLAITFPIMNLSVAFSTLIGAGAAAMVSIRMGQKRQDEAIHILGNAFILSIVISIVFAALTLYYLDDLLLLFGASKDTLPYAKDFMQIILMTNVIPFLLFGLNNIMRASGHPTKAMISILLTVGINVILAPIFIFVFHWSIKGAAWATVIAQFTGMCWVLVHFVHKKHYVHFVISRFRLSEKIILDIIAVGISPFMIHAMACIITILINLQLVHFGGDLAVGSYGIINCVTSLIVMVILGLTQGMQPIVGYNFGAEKMDRVIKTLKLTILWSTGISTLGFFLAELFPTHIAHAFTIDPTMIQLTSQGLIISMIAFPIVGFQIVASNFFQAIGKAKLAIFNSLSRQLLFLIPLLFIFPIFWELNGVWISIAISDCIASLVSTLLLVLFLKKVKKGEIITVR